MLSILPALLLLLLNGTSTCDHLVATDGVRHVANAGLSLSEVCHALAGHVLVSTTAAAASETTKHAGLEPTEVRSPLPSLPATTLRRIAQETSRDRDGPSAA